jgi:phosphoribosylamine--glycine ligase/phosphoribosylformylglycinamidine cyclo-ligase
LQKESLSFSKINIFGVLALIYSVIGTIVFHAGTTFDGRTLKTSGGRVFAVSAIADTLEQAVKAAYEGVKAVSFKDIYFRTDIAKRCASRDSKL